MGVQLFCLPADRILFEALPLTNFHWDAIGKLGGVEEIGESNVTNIYDTVPLH